MTSPKPSPREATDEEIGRILYYLNNYERLMGIRVTKVYCKDCKHVRKHPFMVMLGWECMIREPTINYITGDKYPADCNYNKDGDCDYYERKERKCLDYFMKKILPTDCFTRTHHSAQ